MALLYIEACAFGLDSLRQLIVSKFETMPALKDNPTLVLQIATEVYPQIPKGDKLFKGFFVKALETCREGPARFPEDYADTLTAKGGDLATDICKAERRRTSVLMAKEARRARRLSYDGLDSQGNRITIYDKSSSEED
ncbi:hypothetical protein MMC17_005060 [Xylographa soralifera]|nr:hypothetical protein [Xylographa soralifera]